MVAMTQITQNSPVNPSPGVDVQTLPRNSVKVVELPQLQAVEREVSEEDVKKAVEQVNREMQSRGGPSETIGFGYEKRLNQLYVQVKDANTGDVIREIPSKDFVANKLAMQEMIGIILDRQV